MKITPEIEAVALALINHRLNITAGNALTWEELDEYERTEIRGYAIAAVRALREPTSRQIVAGLHEDLGPYDVATSYTAMIDAALGENK